MAAALTSVLILLVGCGTLSGDASADPGPEVSSNVPEEARAAGASEAQLAALADGKVTYEEYESAMDAGFRCMREAGLAVNVMGTKSLNGVTLIDYAVSGASAATDLADGPARDLQQECYLRESAFVDRWWQVNSPDAVAYAERRDVALEPLLRDCLRRYDIEASDDASMLDLIRLSTDLVIENSSADCLGEVDYSGWTG